MRTANLFVALLCTLVLALLSAAPAASAAEVAPVDRAHCRLALQGKAGYLDKVMCDVLLVQQPIGPCFEEFDAMRGFERSMYLEALRWRVLSPDEPYQPAVAAAVIVRRQAACIRKITYATAEAGSADQWWKYQTMLNEALRLCESFAWLSDRNVSRVTALRFCEADE